MHLACFLLAILLLVVGRPVPSKLGVDVTKAGKLKVAVDGSVLRFSNTACPGRYLIKYATTDTPTSQPGFCGLGEGGGTKMETMCTLKLDADGLLEINAMMIPPGCSVKLINAYFPEEDEQESSGVPVLAIIVPCVIVGILLVATLVTVVIWCYKRRKLTSRATSTISATAVQPSPSDSLPTAFPSSTALEPKTSTDKPEASTSSMPAPVPPNKPRVKKVFSETNKAMQESRQKLGSNRSPIRSYRNKRKTESAIFNSFHYMRDQNSKISQRSRKSASSP